MNEDLGQNNPLILFKYECLSNCGVGPRQNCNSNLASVKEKTMSCFDELQGLIHSQKQQIKNLTAQVQSLKQECSQLRD